MDMYSNHFCSLINVSFMNQKISLCPISIPIGRV